MARKKDRNGFPVFDDPPPKGDKLKCDCWWPKMGGTLGAAPSPHCTDCKGTGYVRMNSLEQAQTNKRLRFGDRFKY